MAVFNECDLRTMEGLLGPHFTTMAAISAFEPGGLRTSHEIRIEYDKSAMPETGVGFEHRGATRRVVLTDRQLAACK